MKLNIAICTLAIGVMLTACKTPQLGYFQDLQDGDKKELTEEQKEEIKQALIELGIEKDRP